jgi:hypothetical protein
MDNLVKKNSKGQIVWIECNYKECGYNEPHCYDCAFSSHDDMRKIMNKLYKYEQTGLTFKE